MSALNDILAAPGVASAAMPNAMDSVKTGMNLASQQIDMQQKQVQTQHLQQQLDDGTWASFQKRANVMLSAPKTVQPQLSKQLGDWMKQRNMDPTIADALRDEDFKAKYIQAQHLNSKDPVEAAQAVQALQSLETFQQGVTGIVEKQQATLQSQNMKEAAMAQQKALAGMKDDTTRRGQDMRLEGTKLVGGIRLDKNEAAAVHELADNQEVKPIQANIMQAKKDFDLIGEARVKGLTPLKATELVQSYVGLLKGMSARSTGGEREELAHAATDIETRFKGVQQKWTKQKGMIRYEDEPFLHDIEDGVRGLHGTLKDSLNQSLNARLRKSGLESVNNAQQAAYNEIMQGAELGFKPRARQVGNAPADVNAGQQPPPATVTPPPAAANPPLTPSQQSFVAKASKLIGTMNPVTKQPYTQADINAMAMKAK